MAKNLSDAKEHDEHDYNDDEECDPSQCYNEGDIVELRKPKALGVIKYIGRKRNSHGASISNDMHYVIQLEEYVGNGNGKWNGYQYIKQLRPDKTMHICKLSNIRCKRSSDDMLKALVNMHRSHKKLESELSRYKQYIQELQDNNWRLNKDLEYFKHKENLKLRQQQQATSESYENIQQQYQPQHTTTISTDGIRTRTTDHHHTSSTNAVRHHLSSQQNMLSQSREDNEENVVINNNHHDIKHNNLHPPVPPNTVNVMLCFLSLHSD